MNAPILNGTAEVLEAVLDEIDIESLRDVMTNAEIAAWMVQAVRARGIAIID